MPRTVLGSGDIVINQTDKDSALMETRERMAGDETAKWGHLRTQQGVFVYLKWEVTCLSFLWLQEINYNKLSG